MILENIPSLFYFSPEIILCLGVITLLIVSVFEGMAQKSLYISLLTVFISMIFVLPIFNEYNILFLGNIVIDPYSNFFKLIFIY